jgi:hypothetical protein
VPAAIIAALAIYGIVHPGLAILWSHAAYAMEPQMSYILTLGSFVTVLVSQLPRSAVRLDPFAGRAYSPRL